MQVYMSVEYICNNERIRRDIELTGVIQDYICTDISECEVRKLFLIYSLHLPHCLSAYLPFSPRQPLRPECVLHGAVAGPHTHHHQHESLHFITKISHCNNFRHSIIVFQCSTATTEQMQIHSCLKYMLYSSAVLCSVDSALLALKL